MKRFVNPMITLGVAAILLLIYFLGIQKTITLEINGESTLVETTSWTISEFLEEQGILLNEADAIEPHLSSFLVADQKISIMQASWFTIHFDDSTKTVFGLYGTIDQLIVDLPFELSPEDVLFLDGALVSEDTNLKPGRNHTLQIESPSSLVLAQGNDTQTIYSTFPTLGVSLWSNEIALDAGDKLDPVLDSPTGESTEVEIKKAKEISIQLSQETIKSKTTADTVGMALSKAGIALQGLDYSRPGANSPVPEDGHIQVIRVKEDQILESETIPFDSEIQPVADLEIDNRSLVQQGVLGLKTKRIRVRYEDGAEISRQVEDEYVSQAPQAEIIGYGTKVVQRTMDTPDGPITYWRALEMYAVSYNVTSNGGYGTATGIPLAKGVAAIDPRYIPYGTQMYVPGYGNALAADTGGGIKGRMIDLGYLDEDYVSWHQWVTVYFLWPPPENIAWIIP